MEAIQKVKASYILINNNYLRTLAPVYGNLSKSRLWKQGKDSTKKSGYRILNSPTKTKSQLTLILAAV